MKSRPAPNTPSGHPWDPQCEPYVNFGTIFRSKKQITLPKHPTCDNIFWHIGRWSASSSFSSSSFLYPSPSLPLPHMPLSLSLPFLIPLRRKMQEMLWDKMGDSRNFCLEGLSENARNALRRNGGFAAFAWKGCRKMQEMLWDKVGDSRLLLGRVVE